MEGVQNQEDAVDVSRVSVVWTVASFGAVLGDVLTGGAQQTRSTTSSGDEQPRRRLHRSLRVSAESDFGARGSTTSGTVKPVVAEPPAMTAADRPAHRLFAALYDPVTAAAERALFGEHRSYLAADLSGTVLDLGAGTGATFPSFDEAQDRAPGLAVHAVEPDPNMRRRAERRAADLGLDVHLVDADAEALPYPDATFDAVVASMVFCTIPDADAALAEVARVLKPGGEFRFFEHVHAGGPYGRIQDLFTPAWRVVAAGCHLNRDSDDRFRSHPAFEVTDLARVWLPVPLVTPFVRGRLVRRGNV